MYNYFCCRKHPQPVKHAVPQLPGMPDTYAAPGCPSCGRTMERYDTGTLPSDPRPVPPPRPAPAPPPRLSRAEVTIYEGAGQNPGHGMIDWTVSRNAAKADLTVRIGINKVGGAYGSLLFYKAADGLIDNPQPGQKEDWWVTAPGRVTADKHVWFALDTTKLPLDRSRLAVLPDPVIRIGVKLGNAAFGLIHLLSGHNKSVRAVGSHKVETSGDRRDDIYVTILSLQTGLKRFAPENLKSIRSDPTHTKLQLKGSDSGFVVLTRQPGATRYSITTIYNTASGGFGTTLYG